MDILVASVFGIINSAVLNTGEHLFELQFSS